MSAPQNFPFTNSQELLSSLGDAVIALKTAQREPSLVFGKEWLKENFDGNLKVLLEQIPHGTSHSGSFQFRGKSFGFRKFHHESSGDQFAILFHGEIPHTASIQRLLAKQYRSDLLMLLNRENEVLFCGGGLAEALGLPLEFIEKSQLEKLFVSIRENPAIYELSEKVNLTSVFDGKQEGRLEKSDLYFHAEPLDENHWFLHVKSGFDKGYILERVDRLLMLVCAGVSGNILAHQLNNFLTVIIGDLDVLELMLPDDPKFRELYEAMLQAVDESSRHIRSYLTLCQVTHGGRKPENLGEIYSEAARFVTQVERFAPKPPHLSNLESLKIYGSKIQLALLLSLVLLRSLHDNQYHVNYQVTQPDVDFPEHRILEVTFVDHRKPLDASEIAAIGLIEEKAEHENFHPSNADVLLMGLIIKRHEGEFQVIPQSDHNVMKIRLSLSS